MVDQDLVARAPDLSTGMKEKVFLLVEVKDGVNQKRRGQKNATQEKLTQKMEAPENQSERALMKGGCNGEVNGNLLEDDFEDFEEREDDEDYFQDENSIGSEVLLTEVEEGVIEERKEQENTTREMEAPETLSENANMEGGGDEEAHENLHENEMFEGNYDDSTERDDAAEYFSDEDSIGSEEEASSGLSDEEYTPTPARAVKPPKRKLVAAQPL